MNSSYMSGVKMKMNVKIKNNKGSDKNTLNVLNYFIGKSILKMTDNHKNV